MDELGLFLLMLAFLTASVCVFVKYPVLGICAILLLLLFFLRLLPLWHDKQRKENLKFVGQIEHLRFKVQTKLLKLRMKKSNIYRKCKYCGKEYRIDKAHQTEKRICPHCNRENRL